MQFAYFTTVIDDTVSVIIIIVVVIVVETLNWNLQRGIEEGEKTFLRVCNLATGSTANIHHIIDVSPLFPLIIVLLPLLLLSSHCYY